MIQVDQQDYQLVAQSLQDFILTYQSSTLKQKPLQKIGFDFELKSSRMLGRTKSDIRKSAGNISINYEAFCQNKNLYIQKILSHEFAHIITYLLYGKVRPHGREFKYICSVLFPDEVDIGLSTYKDSDFLLKTKRAYKKYLYRCSCQKVYLTSIRHNKILKKRVSYFCKNCKCELVYDKD